jgi:hypothetical protein
MLRLKQQDSAFPPRMLLLLAWQPLREVLQVVRGVGEAPEGGQEAVVGLGVRSLLHTVESQRDGA